MLRPAAPRPMVLSLGLLLAGGTALAAELGDPADPTCPQQSREAEAGDEASRKRGSGITASASGKAGVSAPTTQTRRSRWPSLLPGMFK